MMTQRLINNYGSLTFTFGLFPTSSYNLINPYFLIYVLPHGSVTSPQYDLSDLLRVSGIILSA